MKKILSHIRWVSFFAIASCASLDHQVAENEPHAVIRFVKPPASDIAVTVEEMDGGSIRYDQDYRIRPGGHDLVIERSGIVVETGNPMSAGIAFGNQELLRQGQNDTANIHVSQDGSVSASGVNPLSGTQSVSMTVEDRRRNRDSQHIVVEAGCRYEHDGVIFRKTGKLRE